ncbi:GPW/gp25 family protein [Methyloglobulus sp.]|uniref:GPW/gp25 family protein n=1 Tax=Methyloglobulus sp. TaxID=2518622 RepID=UPI0032B85C61
MTRPTFVNDRLGSGWNFPITPDPLSRKLRYTTGVEKVRQSILIILETEPGERIMRPTFGCGLHRYLMKPNTPATRTLIKNDVEFALSSFEPRIRTTEVSVEPGDDPSLALIQITYVHLVDGSKDNLVYPFYLE